MRIKTTKLTGVALDWAVAKCEGRTIVSDPMAFIDGSYWIWEEVPSDRGGILIDKSVYKKIGSDFSPSTDWSLGGPIIEREGITISALYSQKNSPMPEFNRGEWGAFIYSGVKATSNDIGSTPLIAAMRCYVACKLGDTVEVPAEILKTP